FVETMIVSAPASREVTSVAEGAMMRSNSPVSNAWITMVLAMMAITSALRPFFLKKPFWSATQIGVFDGVLPAQAMRILSWAAKSCGDERQTAMNAKYSQKPRRIGLAPSNRNEFSGMALGKI